MGAYTSWLNKVHEALEEMNMATDAWQAQWAYNFRRAFESGISPSTAAERSCRYWWREQHKSLRNECDRAANCWLERGHEGECQPIVMRVATGDASGVSASCIAP